MRAGDEIPTIILNYERANTKYLEDKKKILSKKRKNIENKRKNLTMALEKNDWLDDDIPSNSNKIEQKEVKCESSLLKESERTEKKLELKSNSHESEKNILNNDEKLQEGIKFLNKDYYELKSEIEELEAQKQLAYKNQNCDLVVEKFKNEEPKTKLIEGEDSVAEEFEEGVGIAKNILEKKYNKKNVDESNFKKNFNNAQNKVNKSLPKNRLYKQLSEEFIYSGDDSDEIEEVEASLHKMGKLQMLEDSPLNLEAPNTKTKEKPKNKNPYSRLKSAVNFLKRKNRKKEENIDVVAQFVNLYKLEMQDKPSDFRKTFLDRALDQIHHFRVRSKFVKYFNSIFVIRILFTIICLITIPTSQQIKLLMVTGSQILFTICFIWYQIKFRFLQLGCFYIFNSLIQEIALSVFMFGAMILSFNSKHIFSETLLYYLEIVMLISIVLSILVEIVSLWGLLLKFLFTVLIGIGKCFKNIFKRKRR